MITLDFASIINMDQGMTQDGSPRHNSAVCTGISRTTRDCILTLSPCVTSRRSVRARRVFPRHRRIIAKSHLYIIGREEIQLPVFCGAFVINHLWLQLGLISSGWYPLLLVALLHRSKKSTGKLCFLKCIGFSEKCVGCEINCISFWICLVKMSRFVRLFLLCLVK